MHKCTTCQSEFKTQFGLDRHKCRWHCTICRQKFYTEKGHAIHVYKCKNRIQEKTEFAAKKLAKKQVEIEEFESLFRELKNKGLFVPKYEVGQRLAVSYYYITKPRYEIKWNRMVREADRRYSSGIEEVVGVLHPSSLLKMKDCILNNQQYEVDYIFRAPIKGAVIHESIEEAEREAKERSLVYKEACEHLAWCR